MMMEQSLVVVAAIALCLSPGVIGPGPDWSSPLEWAAGLAAANLPPLLILPVLFRLRGARLLLTLVASAGIVVAQVAMRVPPNLYVIGGYAAVAAMAHLARDLRDLGSAIVAASCGVLVGVACGSDDCTPIETVLPPIAGITVRRLLPLGRREDPASPTIMPMAVPDRRDP